MRYCPLCRAEYREGLLSCVNCGATLVDSLGADEGRANPPCLLCVGRDATEFDLIVRALLDAQIPVHAEQGFGGLIGSLLNSESKIHVLRADFDRALEIAGAAAARRLGQGATQICHVCSRECSASLTACPACKSPLIVEAERGETPTSTSPTGLSSGKFCPLCSAGYTVVHDRCTVCGVELISEDLRGFPRTNQERNERLEVVWSGGDPVVVSEVIAALRNAGVRHSVTVTHDYYVFGLAMPQPRHEVRVFASDVVRAKEFLADIPQGFAVGSEMSPDSAREPGESDKTLTQPKLKPWNPAAATVEIWSGADAALIQVLEDCLRENRIGVRRGGREPGMMRLSVMQQDEAAAREIVREVREGTPQS